MLNLGIDVGTTAVKAAVFDEKGRQLSQVSVGVETISQHSGWSEQDMQSVWSATKEAIIAVLADVEGSRIVSVGIAGQGDGLWALDKGRRPVRNAILWNDQRASGIVQNWIDDGVSNELAKICRTEIWPGTSAAAYAWLKEYEPDNAEKIAKICNAKDWIGFKLTGELSTDYCDATIPFFDLKAREYQASSFEICGVPELKERVLAPNVASEVLGYMRNQLAAEFGLPKNVTVAVGTLDLAAMHIGAGLNRVGESLLILGTTAVVSTVVDPSIQAGKPVGATVFHPGGENWLNVQAPQSGASAVDWLAGQYPETWADGAIDLIKDAQEAEPGSSGVVFLPYLTGERAPFVAPDATGAFLGLTTSTSKRDMARAVLEGVAYTLRHCVEATGTVSSAGFVATGGGARSGLWRQILADTLQAPVRYSDKTEYGLWGAALLGADAAGFLNAYDSSADRQQLKTTEPNAPNVETYNKSYEMFCRYRAAVSGTWS